MQPMIFWLALVILMTIIELATMGLTTIWFAGGALVALLAALLQIPVALQGGIFIAVSVLLLFFTRPLAARYLNNRVQKTNSDLLIGQTAMVTEMINNQLSQGKVQVNGMDWTARSADDGEIAVGTAVVVQEIQGVKLIVYKRES